jgi:hypothetical protein
MEIKKSESSGSARIVPGSTDHETLKLLVWRGEILQREVMLIGFGGRLGSTPALFVGIGLGRD